MVLFFKGFLPKIANFKGNSPGNGLFAKNTVVSRFLRFSRRVGDSDNGKEEMHKVSGDPNDPEWWE